MQITLQHIHVTFEGKAKWFYWKIFCKEPPRVNQILHQVQSHMYTQKIATIFDHIKSHNGQALNHRRLIRPGKKSGRILCVRQVYFTVFYKILPTNLGEWKPTFLPFVHHIWGATVLWLRHCFYHTDLWQNAVFHNFAIQITLIQYSGRSKHAWAF